jgi:hypothetical protein
LVTEVTAGNLFYCAELEMAARFGVSRWERTIKEIEVRSEALAHVCVEEARVADNGHSAVKGRCDHLSGVIRFPVADLHIYSNP